jgi:hypothetical protein
METIMTQIEPDNMQPAPEKGRSVNNVTSDTARQGPLGGRVLLVLIGSTVGAALACLIAYILIFHVH